MEALKLYDCDVGVVIRGVKYTLDVDSVTIEDPERKTLTRGANSGNRVGIVVKEGAKEPKVWTTSVVPIPVALHALLKEVYDEEERVELFAISRATGSGKFAKKAILSQRPQQLTLDESVESLNTALVFASFDVEDILKE